MLLSILLACSSEEAPTEPSNEPSNEPSIETGDPVPVEEVEYIWMSDIQKLNRISMALRGTRPDSQDVLDVLEDPNQLESIVDKYLDGPEFGATIRDMYAEILQMRSPVVLPPLGDLLDTYTQERKASLSEESLGLIEHIVMADRPFTDIVTTNDTVLDEVAALTWAGHSYDFSVGGEQLVQWEDGRPPAGILTTNSMLTRWESNGDNHNRERANLVSRALLCDDYALRDIPLTGNIDLSDPLAVADAVNTQPECVACHQSLDPLAAHFWGFRPRLTPANINNGYASGCDDDLRTPCYPVGFYYSEGENTHAELGLRPPSYFGASSTDTATLGANIAADPRFAQCQATQFAAYLTQTVTEDVPFELVLDLTDGFVNSGFSAKELAKQVVMSPTFLAQGTEQAEYLDTLIGLQIIRPEQYARLLKQLTGFDWVVGVQAGQTGYGDASMLNDDTVGYRSMTGGVDGENVATPTHSSTPNRLLMMKVVSLDAASFVVDNDLAQSPSQRTLLNAYTGADDAELRSFVQDMHRRVFLEDVEIDSAEVDADVEFLEQAFSLSGNEAVALKLYVAALLQSPDVLFY